MKKNIFKTVALLIATTLTVKSFGQSTATSSANVTATIVTPIALSKNTDLQFGSVVPGTSSGTVTLTAASSTTLTATGCSSLSTSSNSANVGTTPTAAAFGVSGEPSYAYTITVPTSASLTYNTVNTLAVGNITARTTNGGAIVLASGVGTGALDATGKDNLYVGGDLSVPAAASAISGAYSGTFSVTVNY